MASTLSLAFEQYDAGNLPTAESLVRQWLRADPDSRSARSLLDRIRRGYGISDGFALSEKAARQEQAPRYLVIKAWGYGFWSEGHHAVTQLFLAELTGRIPVIHWGSNCLFRNEQGDTDVFGHFFVHPSTVRLHDLPADADIFPPKWTRANIQTEDNCKWEGPYSRLPAQYLLDRDEQIVVSDFYTHLGAIVPWIAPGSDYFGKTDEELYPLLFRKYLKPSQHLAAIADDFASRHMLERAWVAVHVRGSDKVNESPRLAETNARYHAVIDRIVESNPGIGIFLLTDSVPVLEEFSVRYGNRLLCTQASRSNTTDGVHNSGQDGIRIGEEVLIDALLATRCQYFVGNQESNVSLAISSIRQWPKGYAIHLGKANVRSGTSFLYHRADSPPPTCRLCKSQVRTVFTRKVLFRYPVDYQACEGCRSMQTEPPYWIEEAYAGDPERFDTGKASRTLVNFLLLPRLLEILGVRRGDCCADFGGGTGLLGRLMRDQGFNFFSYDKYGSSEFSSGFCWEQFDRRARLVTVFECAEHFVNPASDWSSIFASDAEFVFGSTGIYKGQGSDWAYLSPESGQHIFFYSDIALAQIAARHQRHAYLIAGYFLFSKHPLDAQTLEQLNHWCTDQGDTAISSLRRWMQEPFRQASVDAQQVLATATLSARHGRIAIDGVFFRYASGISRLWKSLLAAWSASGFGSHVLVIDRARTAPRLPGISYIDAPAYDYADPLADRTMLQEVCDREAITLFISTYYTTPLTTRSALMVPDMIPEVMGFDLTNPQWQQKHRAIRYCSNYIAISKSTARDLTSFFPEIKSEQVVTAYCGTDFQTPRLDQVDAFKSRHGIQSGYFLISGNKTDYKNSLLFFKAFSQFGELRRNYEIVCTNSPPTLEPEFLVHVGPAKVHLLVLSDADLQCAYAGAIALAYPSRYEGFGLPVLEAMACSCPVITCRNSSLPEVAGDAAIYVDEDDPDQMLNALQAVQSPEQRSAMIARGLVQASGFSWRRMAEEVAEALSDWAVDSRPS